METNICKNCNYQTNEEFCSKCGHPVKLKKIDRDFIIQEIKSALFTDKGFLYTSKKIILSPGDSVRQYIEEDRSRYVKPITYLIVTSLIYAIISHLLKSNYYTQYHVQIQSAMNHIFTWIMENRVYSSIIMDFYMAFFIKILFRKSKYNLFEIFILMCYLSGIKVLFISVALIIQTLVNTNIITVLLSISMIYSFWAIGQFFEKKKAKSYFKAILSYVMGAFSLSLIFSIVAIIEALIRQ